MSQLLVTVFFGGMCLLGIGIIGRYLGVIVEETRGRPKWAVRRVLAVGRLAELPVDALLAGARFGGGDRVT